MVPHHFALSWWLLGAAVILLLWLFEASVGLTGKLRQRINELERAHASPLEIIFDPSNPARRFWSIEALPGSSGQSMRGGFWEYRVEIKNNSSRTLKNVSVTTEHVGQMPIRPVDQPFDKIRKTSCDLKPGCSELVPVVRWPIPIRQVGMLAGPSALEYGPIKVIASADDSTPSIRVFRFDYQAEPMLFDCP